MCNCCNDIFNIHERIANHDFVEQMREFYGLEEKYLKDRKRKNLKKSVLSKMEYQLEQMKKKAQYQHFEKRIAELLNAPFDKLSTPEKFYAIMNEYYEIRKTEIFEYYKTKG